MLKPIWKLTPKDYWNGLRAMLGIGTSLPISDPNHARVVLIEGLPGGSYIYTAEPGYIVVEAYFDKPAQVKAEVL